MNSNFVGPLSYRLRSAVEGDELIIPLVIALFLHRCPAAVSWLVVAILVWESVKRVLWRWSASHVGKEVDKTVLSLPSLTDLNSATAPFGISLVRDTTAPLYHAMPRRMFWGTLAANAVAVLHCPFTRQFVLEAPARLTPTIQEALSGMCLDRAALAPTKKLPLLAAREYDRIGFADYGEATEDGASCDHEWPVRHWLSSRIQL